MPTFELTPILEAAAAVGTAALAADLIALACESATSLVEVEFKKVPATQFDEAGAVVDPPVGCLKDVLAQEGMCELINQARTNCQHRLLAEL